MGIFYMIRSITIFTNWGRHDWPHKASKLIEEWLDLIPADKNPEAVRRVSEQLDCLVLNQNGSQPRDSPKISATEADRFLARTSLFELNIVASGLVIAKSKMAMTLVRVENPLYSALPEAQFQDYRIRVLINPWRSPQARVGALSRKDNPKMCFSFMMAV